MVRAACILRCAARADRYGRAMTDDRELIRPVLADLADLIEQVPPESYASPTPCPGMDVGGIRDHVVGWSTFFGQAFTDPTGEKPRIDPTTTTAPVDPKEAADAVRAAANSIDAGLAAGALGGDVKMVQAAMPGSAILGMALWEYQMHGWDLARGAGLPWSPAEAAAESSLVFAPSMLTDEYRGEGKDFGEIVPVPDDAPALDRLLGFSGRNPSWTPTS